MNARHELKRLERLTTGIAADGPEPTSWYPCPVAVEMRRRPSDSAGDVVAVCLEMVQRICDANEHSRSCPDCVPMPGLSCKQAPWRWQRYHAAWNAWSESKADVRS